MFSTGLYNVVMAVITATAIWSARRNGSRKACLLATAAVGGAAMLIAVGLPNPPFGAIRLLAYGVFCHLALVSAGCALVLRRAHRKVAFLFFAAFTLLEGIAFDAFLVEPHWLEVSHVRIVTEKLNEPIRIALLADLQTDNIGSYENSVIEGMMAEKPDLILLAGDYIQESNNEWRRELLAELCLLLRRSGFSARLGVFAVQGNVDHADWTDGFTDTSITVVPKTRTFDTGPLAITCLSMADSFARSIIVQPSDQFHIVLGHCPNFALGDVAGDLLLAGHCHGGQVRLPFIGPVVTLSRVPRSWAAGVTSLSGGRTLIVSRGVGMERGAAPRMRFLCRPELVIIELVPQ